MALKAGTTARTTATGFMAGDEGNELFGPASTSETSGVVQVDDEPIVVRAHHLGPGERVQVELVDGAGQGDHIGPYMRGGHPVCLTRRCNQIALAMPGRYRFVLDGAVPGVPYVRYFRASMTHEFLLEAQMSGGCDDAPSCLPPCGPAGGDLEGAYPNPQVNALQVVDRILLKDTALTLLAGALCEAMNACIASAAADASVRVTGVTFNPITHVLTITSSDHATVQVDLSALAGVVADDGVIGTGTLTDPVRAQLSAQAGNALVLQPDGLYAAVTAPSAVAPAASTGDALPTRLYGTRTAVLGEPAGWADLGGGRKVPYWQ